MMMSARRQRFEGSVAVPLCGGEERWPQFLVHIVVKRVTCPSEGRTSLGEELGAEVLGGGDACVVKELETLSKHGSKNLGCAANLNEGCLRRRHKLKAWIKI